MHAAAVASGAAGFLTGADKAKLDGIASGATNSPLSNAVPQAPGTPAAGSGTSAARDDHKHARYYVLALFFQASNVAANQAAVAVNFKDGDTNFPFTSLPWGATLIGLSVNVSGNPSGVCTVKVKKNGSADATLTVATANGTTRHFEAAGTGASFNAGDTIGCEVATDAGWTATHDIMVAMFFSLTA